MWEAARSYVGHTPLTCTNVVGDTGIEPVTSSVSGTGSTSAEVRPRASVQVSRHSVRVRILADERERNAVGVRVGVRVRRAVEANIPDHRGRQPPVRRWPGISTWQASAQGT